MSDNTRKVNPQPNLNLETKGNQCPQTGAHFLFAAMCEKLEPIAKSRGLEFGGGKDNGLPSSIEEVTSSDRYDQLSSQKLGGQGGAPAIHIADCEPIDQLELRLEREAAALLAKKSTKKQPALNKLKSMYAVPPAEERPSDIIRCNKAQLKKSYSTE